MLATFSWNQTALFAEPSSEADLRGVIEYGSGGTLLALRFSKGLFSFVPQSSDSVVKRFDQQMVPKMSLFRS